MKPLYKKPAIWLIAATAVLIAACGGGGDTATTGLPPPVAAAPPMLTVGPITGFGSVIVNGVRFDDSAAKVEIEDSEDRIGDKNGGLQIGMVVALKGDRKDDGSGHAQGISMEAEIRGPVQSVTPDASGTGGTLVAMGQSITTTATTTFLGVTKLADLKAGDIVQIHGLNKTSGEITAFLIQKKDSAIAYKTYGKVSAHDATGKTFKIGTLLVKYDDKTLLRKLPATSWNDLVVRVRGLATDFTASPLEFKAARIKQAGDFGDDNNKLNEAEVKGFISDLAADKSGFKINGVEVKVDGKTAYLPTGKSASDLATGVLVEAEGSIANGVITATKVKFENENELEVELKGAISNFKTAADGTFAFTVRNQDVVTTKTTAIDLRGRAAALADGVKVEVKGRQIVDGKLIAARVKVDD